MSLHKIILLGYMGSGKSAVGTQLAKNLGISFVDLDDYIELKAQDSIPNIFKTKGELFFRALERKCLEELVLSPDALVVSLGGGTPCYYDTMEFIRSQSNVHSVYLKTSLAELTKRLFTERSYRPMISHLETIDQLHEFIGKHLFERAVFYQRATVQVSTDQKSVEDVVRELGEILS
jgi:shikimate kinase